MARVTGVGGVFLRSADPARLAAWYAEHLGITVGAGHDSTFLWSDEVPAGTGMTIWAAFPAETTYFGTAEAGAPPQAVMMNYRVDDLDGLLTALAAKDVWIDPKRDNHDYGLFAWIRDCDGNRVELWQPLG